MQVLLEVTTLLLRTVLQSSRQNQSAAFWELNSPDTWLSLGATDTELIEAKKNADDIPGI